jgi:hypothetical protein
MKHKERRMRTLAKHTNLMVLVFTGSNGAISQHCHKLACEFSFDDQCEHCFPRESLE